MYGNTLPINQINGPITHLQNIFLASVMRCVPSSSKKLLVYDDHWVCQSNFALDTGYDQMHIGWISKIDTQSLANIQNQILGFCNSLFLRF